MRRHLLFTAVAAILAIGVSAYLFSVPERAAKEQRGARRDDGTTAGSNFAQTAPGKIRDGLRSAGSRSDWESIPRGFARNQQLERDGYEIGTRSMADAWQTFEQIEDSADRASFLRGMMTAAAQLPPRTALSWIKRMTIDSERELAMQTVASAWRGGVPPKRRSGFAISSLSEEGRFGLTLVDGSRERAELALAWADELVGSAAERAAIHGSAAAAFTAHEFNRVASIASAFTRHEEQEIFRQAYASAFATLPAPAAAWSGVQQLPEGALRSTAMNGVLAAWSRSDPAAAIQAVEALPAGEERNGALGKIAEIWASNDTAAALAWSAKIAAEDRATMNEAIARVAPVGIGASLEATKNGYPVVRELLPDGAAARSALILPGSAITAITDSSGTLLDTKGMALADFVAKVRGKPGTRITLFVQAPGASAPAPVELVRSQIIHKTASK